MLERSRLCLNRILCPELGIKDFFALAAEVGIRNVELRNDLPALDVVDNLAPEKILELSNRCGIRIISINALQQFNLVQTLSEKTEELYLMIELALSIGCEALVLCPNNERCDTRSESEKLAETTRALKTFGPLLQERGLKGYVEPLGFPESSLRSAKVALEAIDESGFDCYRLLHDTFHHYLGPDNIRSLANGDLIHMIGLIHVSGVEDVLPLSDFRDEHRVLVTENDRLMSRRQIGLLLDAGYTGLVSFEPFSTAVQAMEGNNLRRALEATADYLIRVNGY